MTRNSEYIKAILDNSPEGIVLIGKNHNVLTFNKTIQEVLFKYHGRKIKEGDLYYPDFVVDGNKELYLDSFNKAIKGEPVCVQNLTVNEHSSSYFEYKMLPVYVEDGDILGVTLSAKDITNEKLIALKLQEISKKTEENEQRLLLATKAANQGVWDWDINENVLTWNDKMYELFGLPITNEIKNFDSWANSLHPEDKSRVIDELNTALETGKKFDTSFRIMKPNGEIVFIKSDGLVLKDKEGIPYRMIGVNIDITERIKLAEKLALSALIVNTTEDAIISINLDELITSWNHGAEKIYGYKAEEIIGTPIFRLIPNHLHEEETMILARIKNGENILHYETIRLDKYGNQLNLSNTISPIFNEYGKVIGASKIARDISLQMKIKLEQEKIMADLSQRNRDLEQFAYIVSHNLRAPVANIIGISNILQKGDFNSNKQNLISTGLSTSVKALDSVIKDLNHILQIRREITENKVKSRFSEIINDIKISISGLIEKENANFVIDFSSANEILTIKSYLHSILYNLISNSIKYKHPNRSLLIEIKSQKLENGITLHYRDNGIGIDLEKQGKHVFGLYKKFHFHKEGKGMGLYMVKTQVEALGGNISINSEVNKGTEFIITFYQ